MHWQKKVSEELKCIEHILSFSPLGDIGFLWKIPS